MVVDNSIAAARRKRMAEKTRLLQEKMFRSNLTLLSLQGRTPIHFVAPCPMKVKSIGVVHNNQDSMPLAVQVGEGDVEEITVEPVGFRVVSGVEVGAGQEVTISFQDDIDMTLVILVEIP